MDEEQKDVPAKPGLTDLGFGLHRALLLLVLSTSSEVAVPGVNEATDKLVLSFVPLREVLPQDGWHAPVG